MDFADDFVIENGILRLYLGDGGEVAVPEGVTALGENVFRDCGSITAVTLPSTLTAVAKGAFWGCVRLAKVELPARTDSLGPWAFFGCAGLREISFPRSLRGIGDGAFQGCKALRELTLPEGLHELGRSAFDGCASLRRVVFPSAFPYVSPGAFRVCVSLREVVMPSVQEIRERAFWGCAALESLDLPGTLREIGADAFYYCTGLSSLRFPESLIRIGPCAFYGCGSLSELTFPSLAPEIGRAAFSKTRWWDSRPDGCVSAGAALLQYKGAMAAGTSLTLRPGTERISGFALCECTGLVKLTVPEGVTAIDESALEGCTALAEVSLPRSLSSIGKNAFKRDASLRSIVIPDAVSAIGDGAFSGCLSLRQVTLPVMLKTLGAGVFSGCGALEKLTVPEPAAYYKSVDGVLFSKNGKELLLYPEGRPDKSYTVPEGVERIAVGAFAGAAKLKRLYLPASLESLEPASFTGAPLEYVRLPRGIRRLPPGVFAQSTHVGFYHPDLAERLDHPVYLGGPIDRLSPRCRTAALFGFLYASSVGEDAVMPWRSSYIEAIRRNEPSWARAAASSEPLMYLMMEEDLLSARSVETLLSGVLGAERTDLTAALLSYKQRRFPQRPSNPFSLDDDSPENRRVVEVSRRRETVLRRVGIDGMRIAAAGRLRKFGFYSPNGVIDMSDLRSFIRKRGGEYQYSVAEDTDCLICNDPSLSPDKIRQAAEMGVPVITEEEFLQIASLQPRRNFRSI